MDKSEFIRCAELSDYGTRKEAEEYATANPKKIMISMILLNYIIITRRSIGMGIIKGCMKLME